MNRPVPAAATNNQAAFKCVVFLVALVFFLGGAVSFLLQRKPTEAIVDGVILQAGLEDQNIVRTGFPQVDFRPLYRDFSNADIDQLQRETFAVRYVYAPFVQFRALPMNTKYVQLTADGVRLPGRSQPWPPRERDFAVFVFGGSTVFGNNLAPDQTVPAQLERELRERFPTADVVVYNLGCGYYYSSQERALFNHLLERGTKPDLAIFVDGLNDFLTPLGIPKFTREFFRHSAPDLAIPDPPAWDHPLQRRRAVFNVLQRYQENVKLISAAASAYDIDTIFVGQPVPYFQHTEDERIYPFQKDRQLDQLCRSGYPIFARLAEEGSFGESFIWAGDVFASSSEPAYSDSIHYSPHGAGVLAEEIVNRAAAADLLPLTALN